MARGGKREGAGRPKGAKNLRTLDAMERFEALDCDPLEGMVRIAVQAEKEGDKALAGNMYKELSQYVYPKKKAVEVKGEMDTAVTIKWK